MNSVPNSSSGPQRPSKTQNVSIDSIRVQFPICSISEPPTGFVVVCKGKAVPQTLWHKEVAGVLYPVRGTYASASTGPFRLRIHRTYAGGPLVLSVWYSASTWKWKLNIGLATLLDLQTSFEEIQKWCQAQGISIEYHRGTICEIHLFCDVALPQPIMVYQSVLQALAPRCNRKPQDFPRAVVRGNKSGSWCLYDKRAQIQSKATKALDCPYQEWLRTHPEDCHLLRVEWRLGNAQKLRQEFGASTIGELLALHREVSSVFTRALVRDILRFQAPESSIRRQWSRDALDSTMHNAESIQLRSLLNETHHVRDRLAILGYNELSKVFSPKVLQEELRRVCGSSTAWYRLRKTLQNERWYSSTTGGVRWGELYEELKAAMLRAIDATQPSVPLSEQ